MRPERKEVFPLTPKPKEDGAKKNDAAKRLLEDVRRERPHPKLIVWRTGWHGAHFLKGADLEL